jgi:hypothetical protein
MGYFPHQCGFLGFGSLRFASRKFCQKDLTEFSGRIILALGERSVVLTMACPIGGKKAGREDGGREKHHVFAQWAWPIAQRASKEHPYAVGPTTPASVVASRVAFPQILVTHILERLWISNLAKRNLARGSRSCAPSKGMHFDRRLARPTPSVFSRRAF